MVMGPTRGCGLTNMCGGREVHWLLGLCVELAITWCRRIIKRYHSANNTISRVNVVRCHLHFTQDSMVLHLRLGTRDIFGHISS